MRLRNAWRTAVLALVVTLLVSLGAACELPAGAQPAPTPTLSAPTASRSPTAATATASPAPAGVAPLEAQTAASGFAVAIRDVAGRVRPSVVQITSEQIRLDQFNQPFTVPAGVGSGVIYDAQGHVLTNNHVVEGAQRLLISLPDGRSASGKLVGRDPLTDLAVVQISVGNLPVAELGDSGKLQVGDWVVAIGNALALPGGPTVTAGVVSALGRTIQEPAGPTGGAGPFLFDVIQTDAPINPGNSGGPLVNLQGQVVGINTLVAGQAEPGVPAQGIGFAIAINTAKPIADQLVATGRAVHPYLGIGYVPLSPAIAAQLGIPYREGAVVVRVAADSPAAQAGLRQGDVITEIDGTPLKTDSALAQIVNSHKPGDTLTLSVVRGNQRLTVTVKLGETPSP